MIWQRIGTSRSTLNYKDCGEPFQRTQVPNNGDSLTARRFFRLSPSPSCVGEFLSFRWQSQISLAETKITLRGGIAHTKTTKHNSQLDCPKYCPHLRERWTRSQSCVEATLPASSVPLGDQKEARLTLHPPKVLLHTQSNQRADSPTTHRYERGYP